MKLVVNEITEEIGKKLVELGYINYIGNTWCKEYGMYQRFALILNPVGEPKNSVVMCYSDTDLKDAEEIDECIDISYAYEDLLILIDVGIIERR